jgi:hypothetical protein
VGDRRSRYRIGRASKLFGPRLVKVLVERLSAEGRGAIRVVSERDSLLSEVGTEETSCRLEGNDSHLIVKTGMREEGVGQQVTQRWRAKFEILR